MIDADAYWAAYDSLVSHHHAPHLSATPKPTLAFAAQAIEGGCLLYRLPSKRSRDDVAKAVQARLDAPEEDPGHVCC
jgi:hypothetical protein